MTFHLVFALHRGCWTWSPFQSDLHLPAHIPFEAHLTLEADKSYYLYPYFSDGGILAPEKARDLLNLSPHSYLETD
jgi:hypothetical protein